MLETRNKTSLQLFFESQGFKDQENIPSMDDKQLYILNSSWLFSKNLYHEGLWLNQNGRNDFFILLITELKSFLSLMYQQ